jgi:eukaryotic-like serine/threonine-protein kinase
MVVSSPVAGRYEIKEILGEGGMGVVYRAFDLKTRSSVALKTMKDGSDPIAVELFSKEWTVLAGINHPNIVDIRDVGEIEEGGQKKPFFVMPLLPGVTLGKLIETSSTRLSVERVVAIVVQVCRGLHRAHEAGLVHRDIKPSNILVMEDDTAKIIDFGVVHLSGTQSITGQKGTWQYMAPEQLDMKPVSRSSDIFSLGVVCYESLTGRKPFARTSLPETAEAVRRYIPPPIYEINARVSELVSLVIHKAMAKQSIHRFSSAKDFSDTLEKAFRNQPIDRFDRARIQPRIERATKALDEGDCDFASEILSELEAEGQIDSEIQKLRPKIDQAIRQKKVRQLLEIARTRFEQNEIPLALEKVMEVLEIDAENGDALAMRSSIETYRTERQIESWVALARRHLERRDFSEARQALSEVLKIRASDPIGCGLLQEIERREEDALAIRQEKEQLYGSAVNAYHSGELSTALSKLERLLDIGRDAPDAGIPDRDAAYQSLYNQVRSERDAIYNAYEEARRNLTEANIDRALEICDEFLAKYPNDAILQSLKLEAVEQQRQVLSTYIAEVGRRVDAEQDLDRKVNIFKEACDRYPTEQQFQQSLKLMRERRDLVASIVGKARHYQEKNLFAEAIGQWDTLRKIYPQYPGIDVEVAQLIKGKDQQSREESKARLIQQIDRSLRSGDFARAQDLVRGGLVEHPQDPELAGLERLAAQGLERSSEARKLHEDAKALFVERRFQEAVDILRRAMELDPEKREIRESLVNALLEYARPMVDHDWRGAEQLVQQASDLDAAHPGTRSLQTLIANSKRKEFVARILADARDLQADGDLEGALSKVEAGLAQYPNENRLAHLHATLRDLMGDERGRKERSDAIGELKSLRQRAGPLIPRDELGSIFDRSQVIVRKYPDDPEIDALAKEVQRETGAPTPVPKESPLPQPSAPVEGQSAGEPAPDGAIATKARSVELWARRAIAKLVSTVQKLSIYQLAAALGFFILLAAVLVSSRFWKRREPPRQAPPPVDVAVQIRTTPTDAIVAVNGVVQSRQIELAAKKTYDVAVSRTGYKSFSDPAKRPERDWNFTLEPEPVRFTFATAEKTGKILIDDVEKGDLQDAAFQDLELPADGAKHSLSVRGKTADLLSFTFVAKPGEVPVVSAPSPSDLIIVGSLANDAVVYSASNTLHANLAGQDPQQVSPDGLRLSGISASNGEILLDAKDPQKLTVDTGNAPALYIALNADADIAYLKIHYRPENAHLYVDGSERRPSKPGTLSLPGLKPGVHVISLKADGYDDHEEKHNLAKGMNAPLTIQLTPKAVNTRLLVEGGTPGAEVLVDGTVLKTLDSFGAAQVDVIPGSRKILFRKEGFEPSPEFSRDFARGQDIRIVANEAKLKEFGTLQFQISPPDARVSYKREGQSDTRNARGHDSVPVPAGKYSITASADGFVPQANQSFSVQSGQSVPVVITLTAEPKKVEVTPPVARGADSFFENPADFKPTAGWWMGVGAGDFLYLRSGIRQFTLELLSDAGKDFILHHRKAEWEYVSDNRKLKIVYDFEGKKFNRRTNLKNQTFNTTCEPTGKTVPFEISIEPHRITVSSPQCKEPDVYTSEDQDFLTGRVGIKPGTKFKIR